MDLKLELDNDNEKFDAVIEGDTLSSGDELKTAIILSLFTDKRVNNERGFWGDSIENDQWGSRLWTLGREKLTEQTRLKFNEYALESLQWLVAEKIASRVEIESRIVKLQEIHFEIKIFRPDVYEVGFKFNSIWK